MSMPTEIITGSVQSSEFKVPSLSDEQSILAEKGFYWREKDGVRMLVCRPLEEAGFANGFSTRLGGVSSFPENDLNLAGYHEDAAENIEENRRRFMRLFNENYQLASCWQVHGAGVRVIKSSDDARDGNQKFDALVSDLENVLIGVKTADCVPVLLGDPKTKACAAIHAGWRGTVNSIVVNAVEKMREIYGASAKDLICAIGPAASGANYEVGQDVMNAFAEKFSTGGKLFRKTRENHALVDLHLANKEQLLSTGAAEENIYTAPFCTMERTDLFFSYRKEKRMHGKTGRLMSVVGRI